MVGGARVRRAAIAVLMTVVASVAGAAGAPPPAGADGNEAPSAPAAYRQLSGGGSYGCAIVAGGTVKCWGLNTDGQLGLGDTANRGDGPGEMGANLPAVDLGTGRTAVSISAGGQHTCAVLDNGSLKCWGINGSGQLGLGDNADRGDESGEMGDALPAVDLGTGRTAVSVSAGTNHTCAVLDNGQVKCWGTSAQGQLGLGDTTQRGDGAGEMGDALPAVDLGTGRTAVAVSVSNFHTCVVLDDGSVKCWGSGANGRLGLGDTAVRGDAAGEMGDALPAVSLGTGRTATAVAATNAGTCAVLDNASLKCWGQNSNGQLGQGDTADRGDGAGEMGDALPAISLGTGRTATSVSGGNSHTCARLDNGSVKCWGAGASGRTGYGDTTDRGDGPNEMGDNLPGVALGTDRIATAVTTAAASTCARIDDGTVKCWGQGGLGRLGLGDTADRGDGANEMGDFLPAVQLAAPPAPQPAPAASRRLSAGGSHSCAILSNGSVKCWGDNEFGKLGLGDTADRGDAAGEMGADLPAVDLGNGRTAVAIAAGSRHTCAVLDNGQLKCWGHNAGGQLGLGDTANRGDGPGEMGDNLPAVDLGTGRTAVSVSIGQEYTCAVLDNGSVKCWGANNLGQAGLGDTAVRGNAPGEMGDDLPAVDLGTGRTAITVSASVSFTCALLDDGSVKCWGSGGTGALGQGNTANRGDGAGEMGDDLPAINLGTGRSAVAITTGGSHVCAVLDNGSVKCWGFSIDGGLGLGNTSGRGDGPGEMGDALPAVSLGTGRTAVGVSAGSSHTCAVLDDGAVKCWGWNIVGQLGLGDTDNRGDGPGEMGNSLPVVALGTGRTAAAISAGSVHACVRLDDGNVKCWGFGGVLGLGDTAARGDGPGEMGDALPVVDLSSPAMTVALSADETTVPVGGTIHYHVTVTNTGDVGLSGLVVSAPDVPDCVQLVPDLLPGEDHTIDCERSPSVDELGSFEVSVSVDSDQTGSESSDPVTVTVTIPAGHGVLKGRVSALLFGNAVSGALVAAISPDDGSVAALDTTDAAGDYAMLVPAGSVWVYRVDPAGGHIAGFHSTTTPTAVGDGATVTVNTQLNRALGGIEGRITDAGSGDGVPTGVALSTNAATGQMSIGAATDSSGFWVIRDLRSVGYLVTMFDLAGGHQPRYYSTSGPSASPAGASTVDVVGGALQVIGTTALPAQATPSGDARLIGTVTGPGGGGLEGVAVVALDAATFQFEAGAVTDAQGDYEIGVDPGSYLVGFADPSGDHQFEWHVDQPGSGLGSATPVAAASGSPGVVDAELAANRGAISGTVVEDGSGDPLAGVWAFAIDATGSVVAVDQTAGDGSYTLAEVPVGAVRVRFYDVSGGYVPEYWDDHAGASGADGYAAANPITLVGGATQTADASLAPTP